MGTLKDIKPAEQARVLIYAPFYPQTKHDLLSKALGLYKEGALEGERLIEGEAPISFVATWGVSKLPSEMTSCRLQFDAQAELSYGMSLPNNQFIGYLIELIKKHNTKGIVDFPTNFYRELLGMKGTLQNRKNLPSRVS